MKTSRISRLLVKEKIGCFWMKDCQSTSSTTNHVLQPYITVVIHCTLLNVHTILYFSDSELLVF